MGRALGHGGFRLHKAGLSPTFGRGDGNKHGQVDETRHRADPPGTASRRAALRLLDAVLRKGLPLEAALDARARELERADDRAFAHAIAAEALRRPADLDALIDGATQKRLPDDAKARFALRIALVQALALGHAASRRHLDRAAAGRRRAAPAGPRRVQRVMRGKGAARSAALPAAVAERWRGLGRGVVGRRRG
jgi:16S rRNA (cytosine967-C5)-methyltransferase